MKDRKLFCKGDLTGRSFEWCIVEDTHPFRAGRPKFVLKELIQDPSTGLLVPTSDRWYDSGPQEMWSDMVQTELGPSKRCRSGLKWCGLDNAGLLQLLGAAEECGGVQESSCRWQFGVHTAVDGYSKHSIAKVVAHASKGFLAAMVAVCPNGPVAASHALRKSQKSRRDWGYVSTGPTLHTPMCAGVVGAYKGAGFGQPRLAILSLWAPYFPYKVAEAAFGVDHNGVWPARLHHAAGLAGVQLEKLQHPRPRWGP